MTTTTTREAYKAELLSSLPPTIGTKKTAELVGANFETIQHLNRTGKLPFKNISLTRHSIKFLTVDVLNWMFARSAGTDKKGGRPVGSKNKDKTQPEAVGA